MTRSIASLLAERVVLLDGGVGSELIARGLELGRPPELWNLERPDDVRAVHAAYVAAGSDVVQTNSFGASPFVLARHGLGQRAGEINTAAARIARAAAGTQRLVAGDIGPSGESLPPVGAADPDELADGFARQAQALAAGGADYLSIETMIDLREALCALRGARAACDLPLTACLTFDRKKRGFFTLMGDAPGDAVKALADAGAAAAGANCSVGSEAMAHLLPELLAAATVPVIVKPNAGLPEVADGGTVYRQQPIQFAADLARMAALGARAVGGCCGTDARFIAALRDALSAPDPASPAGGDV